MSWRLAAHAEIVGCRYQAFPEMSQPDAVGHDARRQRVVAAGDAPGQLKPAASLRGEWSTGRVERAKREAG